MAHQFTLRCASTKPSWSFNPSLPTCSRAAHPVQMELPVVIFVYGQVDQAESVQSGWAQNPYAAQNQFWGDRTARIIDPSGHVWTVASRIEETTGAAGKPLVDIAKDAKSPEFQADRTLHCASQLCRATGAPGYERN